MPQAPRCRLLVCTAAILLVCLTRGKTWARPTLPSSAYDGGILARDIVTGDFDGNGVVDLGVLSQGNPAIEAGAVRAMLGNGDGTFRSAPPVIIGQTPFTLVAGDLDSDGKTDLVIDMNGTGGFRVLLSNGDGTFRSAPSLAIPTSSARGVLADFTSDGKPDLLIVKGTTTATFEVYTGVGDGTFVAPPAPTAVPSVSNELVVADVNRDGKADVVAGAGTAGARVFLGNGDGTFSPILALSQAAYKVAKVADIDNDGRPDLVVGFGDPLGGAVSMYRGNGDGTFQEPAAWSAPLVAGCEDISTGDIDGDGRLDVVTTNFPGNIDTQQVHTFLGTGGGALAVNEEFIVGDFPFRTVLADFDGQRGDDLALVAVQSHSAYVLLAGPGGMFSQPRLNSVTIPFGPLTRATVIADFDQDGIPDLAGVRFEPDGGSTIVGVARGLGGGGFGEAAFFSVGLEPSAMIAADVNGDGVLDLVTTNNEYFGFQSPVPGSVSVLIGVGNGDFHPEARYQVGFVPVRVSAKDLDGDGDLDLVIANSGTGIASQESLSILAGNGDGTFAPQRRVYAGAGTRDLEVADFTGDGRPDIVAVNRGDYPNVPAELSLLPGTGGLTFGLRTIVAQGLTYTSLAAGDLDGDGDIDLLTTDEGTNSYDSGLGDFGHSKVLLNDGHGSFQASAPMRGGIWPSDGKIVEINGDGIPDVMMTNYDSDDVAFFPGRGDGTFGPAERHAVFHTSVLAVAHFDGDSRPDLIVFTTAGLGAYLNVGSSTPQLSLGPGRDILAWGGVPFSTGYDVVKGDLSALKTGGFPVAILGCLQNDGLAQRLADPAAPPIGKGFFYLVRAINPTGAPGTYDSEGPGQAAPRDAAIAMSALACP